MGKAESASAGRRRARRGDTKSHLYTDDNPATTLHGTGFKDGATARRTIALVSRRSLTYQMQTINTMLCRARGHPRRTAAMEDAIVVLRAWMDDYPARRDSVRRHKLSSKGQVSAALKQAEERNEDADAKIDTAWAELYVGLAKGKRLANTLMLADRPDGDDLDSYRQKRLDEIAEATSEADVLQMRCLGYEPPALKKPAR